MNFAHSENTARPQKRKFDHYRETNYARTFAHVIALERPTSAGNPRISQNLARLPTKHEQLREMAIVEEGEEETKNAAAPRTSRMTFRGVYS